MIDIRRSTVKRSRSALRMREKSAAAMPVRPWAARMVRRSRSSVLMISGGQDGLELIGVRVLATQIAENIPAPPRHLEFFLFHRNISFSLFKRSLVGSISRLGVLMPCVDFFWKAFTTQISSASWTA